MNTSSCVFLIGFMGCGKSTFGQLLAKELQWSFLDTDDWIEETLGMSISEIFEIHGEAFFRNQETKALNHALSLSQTVVATGGGLPCNETHIQKIKENTISVYIEISPIEVIQRLKGETEHRPLLQMPEEELFAWIEKKMESRRHFYEQATLRTTHEPNLEKVVQELKKCI